MPGPALDRQGKPHTLGAMDAFFGWLIIIGIGALLYHWLAPRFRRWRAARAERKGQGHRAKGDDRAGAHGRAGAQTEIDVDRFARNPAVQGQLVILARPEIPFLEVSRLAESENYGVAAIGLTAIYPRRRSCSVDDRGDPPARELPRRGRAVHLPDAQPERAARDRARALQARRGDQLADARPLHRAAPRRR